MTGLLLALALAAALPNTNHILSWDYPVALQPGTSFTLALVTLRGGRAVTWEQPLPLLAADACPEDALRSPATLCSALCLEAGEYTLTVRAHRGGVDSPPSPILDADLRQDVPCRGAGPPVATQPKPPPETGKVIAGVVLGGAAAALLAAQSVVPPLPALVNRACVTWKVTGVCLCGPFTPCITVEYWEPAYLIETVKKPGDSVIPVLGDVLQVALSATGVPEFGGGGAANATGQGHTNLQYGEARVYGFPQLLGGPCTACAPSGDLALHYASEIDSASWRTTVATPSPLDLVLSIGPWAHLYPRGGHVIHSSEPVASGVQAVRALDIMRQPIGIPPNVDAHIIVAPGDAGTPVCLQMAFPKQTPCFHAGFPNALWETGALSLRGKYLWIAWKKRRCCVDPARTTCGITLPGVGLYGANTCILPQIPSP